MSQRADLNRRPLPYQGNALPLSYIGKKERAGDRARTGDNQLGRLKLYQLSYSRIYTLMQRSVIYFNISNIFTLVGRAGFEPAKT